MKDRIKLIMDKENLTPAKFADRLDINRAIISHILNGRNNPSLDVVTKILTEMNYINPQWLITGVGNMYKEGFSDDFIPKEPDLFTQTSINAAGSTSVEEKSKEISSTSSLNDHNVVEEERFSPVKSADKKITQIIIYFNDNTFEIFRRT